MQGKTPQSAREYNIGLILTLIRNNESISRAELARLSNLSKPVVTAIVEALISRRLVIEQDKGSISIGRPPMMLGLDLSFYRFIGMNISRLYTELVVTDLAGNICQSFRHPLVAQAQASVEHFLNEIIQAIKMTDVDQKWILGIGAAYPFPFNSRKKWVIGEHDIPDWTVINVAKEIQNRLAVPVWTDNDANIAALYEKWNGAAQSFSDFIYFLIGDGLGSGIFTGDRLVRGAYGFAGEFGHTSLSEGTTPCECGNIGCLETRLSLPKVRKDLAAILYCSPEEITVEVIQGSLDNPTVLSYLKNYQSLLGLGIANLINLFNPSAIIIGGEISKFQATLLCGIDSSIAKHVHPALRGSYQIVFNGSKENAVVKGASVLVQNQFFRHPHALMSFTDKTTYTEQVGSGF